MYQEVLANALFTVRRAGSCQACALDATLTNPMESDSLEGANQNSYYGNQ